MVAYDDNPFLLCEKQGSLQAWEDRARPESESWLESIGMMPLGFVSAAYSLLLVDFSTKYVKNILKKMLLKKSKYSKCSNEEDCRY